MDDSLVGPAIPQHILERRKRKAEEELVKASKSINSPGSPSSEEVKRKRVAGPAPPPAPLDQQPTGNPHGYDNSDSSDDEFGPMLPPGPEAQENEELAAQQRLARFKELDKANTENDGKPKRDEWMIVPPKSEDWAAKVDPTKIKNRKFNTGKGAKAPNKAAGENTLWTETPEEKRKRLEDEVMGRKRPATQGAEVKQPTVSQAEAEETARRIREYNEKNRGKTLYSEHKSRQTIKEDDPSKRAFDREKDIAGGIKIGTKQKKEMLERAAQFGDRFSSGSYL
ncbi:hypothetical protein EDC01DRAFT_22376 [Geopyxis carbonaria]|nr:hypothetical protein EDC01DRAFT_22376 [Geopyxis carbonaria]